ncbi:MAG: hypothetical protein M3328_12625 [Chloroflexota bacterium]|nr:hypothetical protein [Chloroflexota bacterium]
MPRGVGGVPGGAGRGLREHTWHAIGISVAVHLSIVEHAQPAVVFDGPLPPGYWEAWQIRVAPLEVPGSGQGAVDSDIEGHPY